MENFLSNYFKQLTTNRISHAFLLCNTNLDNLKEDLTDVLSDYFFNYKVDLENDTDIYIIRPNNNVILKEDILNLQSLFKNKSQFNKNRVYIIDQAEKMNDYASNSLLKFLEEPESDVYAFLITNNINKMMNTIVSRCQSIVVNNTSIFNLDTTNKDFVIKIVDFVKKFEKEKLNILVSINDYFDKKEEKKNFILYMSIMKYYYRDILNYMIYKKVNVFNDYEDIIKEISLTNNFKSITDKLILLNKYENMLEYNVNLNLFLDNLIIEMEEVSYE